MNRRAIALVLTLAALLLGVATGCGGDDDATSDDTTTTTVMPLPVPTTETDTTETEDETETVETETSETDTTEGGGADLAAGRTLFTGNGCGSCHTFADAGTNGAVGPNLDEASVDESAAETQIRNGGNGMPAFDDQLTDDEIQTLADYVVAARE